jgi:hypothetical protein
MQFPLQKRLFFFLRPSRQGVALVLVLAFVVLLASIIVAFFSRAMAEQQISRSSANQTKVKLLVDGAVDTIIGDLKAEIIAGSTAVPITAGGVTTTIYSPRSSTGQTYAQNTGAYTTMLPAPQGFTRATFSATTPDPLANLVKVSANAPFYSGAAYAAAGPTRAAASPTNTGARPISPARWNKPLFLQATSTTDFTPQATFPTPSWIYVAKDDSQNPVEPDDKIIGRYAYAIYDEGGLLDINVAGFPDTIIAASTAKDAPYTAKNALAYADLTQLQLTQPQIEAIVNWRNEATISQTDGFKKSAAFHSNGYLRNGNSTMSAGAQGSDRLFASRQQFINFLRSKVTNFDLNTQNALQYLTTFSRAIEQPSNIRIQATNSASMLDFNGTVPAVQDQTHGGNFVGNKPVKGHDHEINPSFPAVRVTAQFPRNDGSTAEAGEPLLKKRFALNRLAWLTYLGPSAERAQGDPDMQALIAYGIPKEYLQQGTRDNIKKYFGLQWDGSTWTYINNAGGPIKKLSDIAAIREPDFFETLKATINVGSLGKALSTGNAIHISSKAGPGNTEQGAPDQPYQYNWNLESSVDRQIIQLGANIIGQFQTANYPPRILFNDGTPANTGLSPIVGVENYPYLFNVFSGILQVEQADKTKGNVGAGAFMQLPVIWNPHDPSSPTKFLSGTDIPTPTKFRIVADSATPDEVAQNAARKKYIVYGLGNTLSYKADQASPGNSSSQGNSWYRDTNGSPNPHAITDQNSGIIIDRRLKSSGVSNTFFNEPTMLVRPGLISDINNNKFSVTADSGNLMSTDLGVKGRFSNGGLLSAVANPLGMPSDEAATWGVNVPCIGFFLGSFPLNWKVDKDTWDTQPAQAAVVARFNGSPAGNAATCYLTYRMQYADPSGNWVTYDTKYGKVTDFLTTFHAGQSGGLLCGQGTVTVGATGTKNGRGMDGWGGYYASVVDPRSSRFGLLWQDRTSNACANSNAWQANVSLPGPEYVAQFNQQTFPESAVARGWIDPKNAILYTTRPDELAGFYFGGYGTSLADQNNYWPLIDTDARNAGWLVCAGTDGSVNQALVLGLLSQNNTSIPNDHIRYNGAQNGRGVFGANYFADPDGIVRRAMGGYVPAGTLSWQPASETTVGLPLARAYDWASGYRPASPSAYQIAYSSSSTGTLNQGQSRPYYLHRPFYSVAELGYVFSDTPWRNLDFSTPESGNAALLDAFCINDTDNPDGLVAGKINLNTRQPRALMAILNNAYLDDVQPGSASATGRLNSTTATNLANALVNRTSDTTQTASGPLVNPSELVGKWVTRKPIQSIPGSDPATPSPLSVQFFYDGKMSYSGFAGGDWDLSASKPKQTNPARDVYSACMSSATFTSNSNKNGSRETAIYIGRFREAPVRVLANVGQTRVWNLMVDVIAQSGRFPVGATAFDKFQVAGEQRYWVHLAIDRFTGKILDQQIEVVKE